MSVEDVKRVLLGSCDDSVVLGDNGGLLLSVEGDRGSLFGERANGEKSEGSSGKLSNLADDHRVAFSCLESGCTVARRDDGASVCNFNGEWSFGKVGKGISTTCEVVGGSGVDDPFLIFKTRVSSGRRGGEGGEGEGGGLC